jgi:hypothetical protein
VEIIHRNKNNNKAKLLKNSLELYELAGKNEGLKGTQLLCSLQYTTSDLYKFKAIFMPWAVAAAFIYEFMFIAPT